MAQNPCSGDVVGSMECGTVWCASLLQSVRTLPDCLPILFGRPEEKYYLRTVHFAFHLKFIHSVCPFARFAPVGPVLSCRVILTSGTLQTCSHCRTWCWFTGGHSSPRSRPSTGSSLLTLRLTVRYDGEGYSVWVGRCGGGEVAASTVMQFLFAF